MITSSLDPSSIKRGVLRQQALATLEEHGVILPEGHFDYGNGFHGTFYINPHELLRYPYRIWQLAQDLMEMIPSTLLSGVEVVAGPVTGGAILAHDLAGLIDAKHDLKAARIQFARLDSDNGSYSLNDFYARVMREKKVLLVDDIRNTGRTFVQCARLISEAEGSLVGTAELYDRMEAVELLRTPNFPLAEFKAPPNMPEAECTLCKLSVPLTKF